MRGDLLPSFPPEEASLRIAPFPSLEGLLLQPADFCLGRLHPSFPPDFSLIASFFIHPTLLFLPRFLAALTFSMKSLLSPRSRSLLLLCSPGSPRKILGVLSTDSVFFFFSNLGREEASCAFRLSNARSGHSFAQVPQVREGNFFHRGRFSSQRVFPLFPSRDPLPEAPRPSRPPVGLKVVISVISPMYCSVVSPLIGADGFHANRDDSLTTYAVAPNFFDSARVWMLFFLRRVHADDTMVSNFPLRFLYCCSSRTASAVPCRGGISFPDCFSKRGASGGILSRYRFFRRFATGSNVHLCWNYLRDDWFRSSHL